MHLTSSALNTYTTACLFVLFNMSNDTDMQDAAAGAEVNGGEEVVFEKQRLRLVRIKILSIACESI